MLRSCCPEPGTSGVALTSASKAFNLAGLKAALMVTASERARAAVDKLPALAEHAGLLGVVDSEVAYNEGDEWLDAGIWRGSTAVVSGSGTIRRLRSRTRVGAHGVDLSSAATRYARPATAADREGKRVVKAG